MNLRAIDVKDKQNYKSIEVILNESASRCLLQLNDKIDITGTIGCLSLMRNLRDAFLNKEISPSERVDAGVENFVFYKNLESLAEGKSVWKRKTILGR